MKQLIRKLTLVLLVALMGVGSANAQKTLDVAKFTKMESDLAARVTKPVRDKDEGKLCAIIRIVTDLTDLELRADALGILQQEQHSGEVWIWVPYGARQISVTHQGYFPLLYQYALPIEEGTVYELRLSSASLESGGGSAQTSKTQMFVLTHNPDEATVFIDGMEVPTENGVFAAMMTKGEHSYKVVADRYEDAEATFELADQPVRETVKLHPLFGTFQLFTLPENDFDVLIDGKRVGVSPYKSGRLSAGSYRVRIEKENFYPVDTLLRLREGDDLRITCKLTSFADSLFYNRELGGHKISFGVTASYMVPFVSSSASGGFTGSPINYSFGNDREDVSYKSQSGFAFGVMADMKLYKNFYLMAGLRYAQYKYTNEFNEPLSDVRIMEVNRQVWQGNLTNSYKEEYTQSMIEVPILASYRFVMTKTGSLHLNFGPYISYGLSAKMKFSGSSECTNGEVYTVYSSFDDLLPTGDKFTDTYVVNETFDLYSKSFSYTKTSQNGMNLGSAAKSDYNFDKSPLNKLNFGLHLGVAYELRGFQLGVGYNLQLTNMANKEFWESERIALFPNKVAENNMSGYKHRIHSFEIKLGYFFRY